MAKIKKNGKKNKSSKKNKNKGGTKTKAGKFIVKKDDDNRIMCLTNIFKGKEYLNIRWQFKNDEDEWCFTAKGITIAMADGMAEEFIEKFKKSF